MLREGYLPFIDGEENKNRNQIVAHIIHCSTFSGVLAMRLLILQAAVMSAHSQHTLNYFQVVRIFFCFLVVDAK